MNTAPTDLHRLIGNLALAHALGAVGLVGSHARGEAQPDDDIDVFVTVPVVRAQRFGLALAEAAGAAVHLHDFARTPWFHPYHLCVIWLNCKALPACACPRGAYIRLVSRPEASAGGLGFDTGTPAERIGHFIPVMAPPQVPAGRSSLRFAKPPIGSFLL